MMDNIVTFQNGAEQCCCDVSGWRRFGTDTPIDNLFSRILSLGTCTDRPWTHRTHNDSIRARLLRRLNKFNFFNSRYNLSTLHQSYFKIIPGRYSTTTGFSLHTEKTQNKQTNKKDNRQANKQRKRRQQTSQQTSKKDKQEKKQKR